MNKSTFVFKIALLFVGIFITGCQSSEQPHLEVIADQIEITVGDTIDLAINTSYSNENLIFSFDETLLKISDERRLTALSEGRTHISVHAKDSILSDQVNVIIHAVNEPKLDGEVNTILVEIGSVILKLNAPTLLMNLPYENPKDSLLIGYSDSSGKLLHNDFLITEDIQLNPIYENSNGDDASVNSVSEVSIFNPKNPTEQSSLTTDSNINQEDSIQDDLQVTLKSDTGDLIDYITISPNSIVTSGSFNVSITPSRIYKENSLCNEPFPFNSIITQSTMLIFDASPYVSPCIELDHLVITGEYRVGETLQVHVSPSAADLEYRWFISRNNRQFFPTSHTGSSLTLESIHNNHYLAVNVIGKGDFTGLLKLGTPKITSELIIDGKTFIPIASRSDLIAMNSANLHTFAEGTVYEIESTGGHSKNYALIDDINLGFTSWTPLFIEERGFQGVFDGRGHTLSNLNLNSEDVHVGLFSRLDGAIIRNLAINNVSITAIADDVGVLAGTTRSGSNRINLISNLDVSGVLIEMDNYANYGGFIGRSNGNTIVRNTSISLQTMDNQYDGGNIGGVVGLLNSTFSAINVNVYGSIGEYAYTNDVGGLIGEMNRSYDLQMTNVSNYAAISGHTDVGGIIGYIDNLGSGALLNVNNFGQIKGINDTGGFFGEVEDSSASITIENSNNYGSVMDSPTGKAIDLYFGVGQLGGLIGFLDRLDTLTIRNTENHATISAIREAGGFIGEVDSSAGRLNLFIENSTNSGVILSSWHDDLDYSNETESLMSFGGLIGYIEDYTAITLSGITNVGNIKPFSQISSTAVNIAGGLIGFIETTTEDISGPITITDAFNKGHIFNEGDDSYAEVFNEDGGDFDQSTAIGGFIGAILNDSITPGQITIVNSFNSGNLTNYGSSGGFIGEVTDNSGALNLLIQNSKNTGTVLVQDYSGGGFIGFMNSGNSLRILNSTNAGIIRGDIDYINDFIPRELGGFVGETDIPTVIQSSVNQGEIFGGYDLGGFVGEADDYVKIEGSANHATLTGLFSIGGLIGDSDDRTEIIFSVNNENIYGSSRLGGLIGESSFLTLIDSSGNLGNINAQLTAEFYQEMFTHRDMYDRSRFMSVGGLIGHHESGNISSLQLQKVYSVGDIHAESNVKDVSENAIQFYGVGGLVGYSERNNVSFGESFYQGSISTNAIGVGGFIGFFKGYQPLSALSSITNSYVLAEIHAQNTAGGIIGFISDYGNFILENLYVSGVINQSQGTPSGLIGSAGGHLIISGSGVFVDNELLPVIDDDATNQLTGSAVTMSTADLKDYDSYTMYDVQLCGIDNPCDFENASFIWVFDSSKNQGFPYLARVGLIE